RRHTRLSRDWSSDVCSSDLSGALPQPQVGAAAHVGLHRVPWLFSLGARYLPAAEYDLPEAIAPIEFSLLSARASGCYLPGRGRWDPQSLVKGTLSCDRGARN